ncbi:MAG: hypothetical protein HOL68_08855 [Bacteroidetes Order II. Incertae sedis bacterium]|jgi:hypothetical protein|nr:hypothetical protein [Bacteroidetes Order II. bacterium]
MNKPVTIVEHEDGLIFSACEFRWLKGDKFALIEAIAICAANDLEYPKWVRHQINTAMSGIFHAVFPDTTLEDGRPGLGISSLPDGPELSKMKDKFKAKAKDANKLLSLKLDRRNIVDTHIKAVRDFELAELICRVAKFAINPSPHFDGITNTRKDLAVALDLSPKDWQELETADGILSDINGQSIQIRSVPSICRMATLDVIDDAWDAYKEFFLEERTERFEDTHGINLGE